MTDINPRIVDGEPMCSGEDCPSCVYADKEGKADPRCAYIREPMRWPYTPCVPMLRRQRDEWKDMARKVSALLDEIGTERDEARATVERLRAESAEAFSNFLVKCGNHIDIGNPAVKEGPFGALTRFRAALAEKEAGR